jgi:hypothetical protein
MSTAQGEVTLNEAALMGFLMKKAEKVAQQTATFTLARAQHHAPVRKIFKGSSFGRSELMSRYASAAGPARKPMQVQALTAEGVKRVGHANSLEPIFKAGNARSSGDFRRIKTKYLGHGATLVDTKLMDVPVAESRIINNQPRDVGIVGDSARAGRKMGSGTSQLTSRGRFEVQSGRAVFTSPDGNSRIGGRLRGELHIEGPFYEGDSVWFQVVSPTPYARPMEFGSVHNRPYSYLRPALHESRGRLRSLARTAFRATPELLLGPGGGGG